MPNTTLLAVTGLTPQIVTETLYALHKQKDEMPAHIHILTTAEGRQRAKLTLINDGWLQRFYQDYDLPMPTFDESDIHVLQRDSGEPLQDIRSREDNQAMADGITEWIRKLTADPIRELHVSIAGGRKTMGFYAGYALSLFGRSQDRLSHVLVSPDYESHPQFYYPTPRSQIIYGNDPTRKPLDTQHAEVVLADIAFVRLRHGLDPALLEGKTSFSRAVANAQQKLGPPELTIDLKKRTLSAHGVTIKLKPVELAFYLWLLNRQAHNMPPVTCPSDGVPDLEYVFEYLKSYKQIAGELGLSDRTLKTLEEGMSKAFFEQRKSGVNSRLKEALGANAKPYLISAVGKRPRTGYWIPLAVGQVHYQES
ncbi:CRISPR-associated ring nuclease Csm6 [Methylotuvimicrobium buryatense]|uniref:TIGR02584 family CRISPR-associated protein n=1 Tax=Methylotuvimicrobium buryatense TaxID=95641 RepID=A0A4P9UNK8_METBY|nr:CRISPR-associated ring nuclease Csm6 [Methylotuvimicrobium buryatense]QCW82918.1 TIGR02584 family CRISPR-associated protein [Methylotuvimicrobium buryatense]